MKAAAISAGIVLLIVFIALVLREVAMKRGMDPVGRLADAVFPLRTTPPATVPVTA